jgi:hypothetical protein
LFHLNIKYKKGSTNRVDDCITWPPVTTLTIVLNSYGHETFGWSQLYASDPDFATTYQAMSTGTLVSNFHLQDRLLCHFGHPFVPSSDHAKLIWEAHYSWMAGQFGVDKMVVVLKK